MAAPEVLTLSAAAANRFVCTGCEVENRKECRFRLIFDGDSKEEMFSIRQVLWPQMRDFAFGGIDRRDLAGRPASRADFHQALAAAKHDRVVRAPRGTAHERTITECARRPAGDRNLSNLRSGQIAERNPLTVGREHGPRAI